MEKFKKYVIIFVWKFEITFQSRIGNFDAEGWGGEVAVNGEGIDTNENV